MRTCISGDFNKNGLLCKLCYVTPGYTNGYFMSTYCIYILYLDYNQNIDEYGYEYIETYKIRRMSHVVADCILETRV